MLYTPPVPNLRSTLTCPECGGVATETMPTDACQYFYDCRHCGAVLRPLAGDCCVFCSYGDLPCPPIQEPRANGGNADCCAGIQRAASKSARRPASGSPRT